MSREPRRVERKDWPVDTHLSAQDGDIDELHRLRLQSDRKHDDDMAQIDRRFSALTTAIVRLTLVLFTAFLALVADIAKGLLVG